MSETVKTAGIHAKMLKAMGSVDAVTKKGRNENQKYNYVKATDVANEVRSVLIEQGIAFSFSVTQTLHWDKQTNSGGTMFYCQIFCEASFTCTDGGGSVTVSGLGWGMDTGDKAPYKAITGALKYVLRCAFLIPDESDPENDAGEKLESVKQEQPVKSPVILKPLQDKIMAAVRDKDKDSPGFKEQYKNTLTRMKFSSTATVTVEGWPTLRDWLSGEGVNVSN